MTTEQWRKYPSLESALSYWEITESEYAQMVAAYYFAAWRLKPSYCCCCCEAFEMGDLDH